MHAKSDHGFAADPRQSSNTSFPHGFLDFLNISPGRRHRIGDYTLQPVRLEMFNRALHQLSTEAPSITLDQIASAGQRALQRHTDGSLPPFVQSRIDSLARLEQMAQDVGWGSSDECRRLVALLKGYRSNHEDLIPDELPVVGLLDDAVLIDVALQLLRDELAEYEDFCRFRKVATEFSGVSGNDAELTRAHWHEALRQARQSVNRLDPDHHRYAPADPRISLFHVC